MCFTKLARNWWQWAIPRGNTQTMRGIVRQNISNLAFIVIVNISLSRTAERRLEHDTVIGPKAVRTVYSESDHKWEIVRDVGLFLMRIFL